MFFGSLPLSIEHIKAGRLRALAVTGATRSEVLPDIPTVDEAGVPGFYMSIWSALWAPKGTPTDIVAKLNAAIVDALADPAVRSQLADLGQEIFPRDHQTPEALGELQRAEADKWWPIIKAANIKGD